MSERTAMRHWHSVLMVQIWIK